MSANPNAKSNVTLEQLRVASPCTANWDEMPGNDQQRFCQLCQLNVYNLSSMTREQAENFVRNAEGRVCIRMYKRADGTVLSKDCPVGFRAAARKIAGKIAAGIMLSFSLMLGGFSTGCGKPAGANSQSGTGNGTTNSTATPTPPSTPPAANSKAPATPGEEAIMGDMCAPEQPDLQELAQPLHRPDSIADGTVLMGKVCADDTRRDIENQGDTPSQAPIETPDDSPEKQPGELPAGTGR